MVPLQGVTDSPSVRVKSFHHPLEGAGTFTTTYEILLWSNQKKKRCWAPKATLQRLGGFASPGNLESEMLWDRGSWGTQGPSGPGRWFQIRLICTPTWGWWSNLANILQMGWNDQPARSLEKRWKYDGTWWNYWTLNTYCWTVQKSQGQPPVGCWWPPDFWTINSPGKQMLILGKLVHFCNSKTWDARTIQNCSGSSITNHKTCWTQLSTSASSNHTSAKWNVVPSPFCQNKHLEDPVPHGCHGSFPISGGRLRLHGGWPWEPCELLHFQGLPGGLLWSEWYQC